ncbi:methyltransferase domain-containing protein [Streptomyces sp. NPDC098085]|uniref:class I SAM-dependent methyltransferase n=1 Tax=Streptomyces sp. NPDC098085 TaxID=3366094 RepID=UPI003816AE1D
MEKAHGDHPGYNKIFTLSSAEERSRLRHLTALHDPIPRDVIGSLTPLVGRDCLEVGAGSGSVAGWLVDQGVQVTALGRDGRFLPTHPRLTTVTGDALADDFDPGPVFDLVHTRFVLIHVPRRDELLERLVSRLRLGGWLAVEETADTPPPAPRACTTATPWPPCGASCTRPPAPTSRGRATCRPRSRATTSPTSEPGAAPPLRTTTLSSRASGSANPEARVAEDRRGPALVGRRRETELLTGSPVTTAASSG